MRGDAFLTAYHRDLVWTGQVLARQLLITMAESSFKEPLPERLREELITFARSFRTTKPVEDQFNRLRESARQHKASKLGGAARWNQVILLEEADREQPTVISSDRMLTSTALPPKLFEAPSEKEIAHFRSDSKAWGAPQPGNFHTTAMGTRALIDAQGDLDFLRRDWLSLLVDTRCVLARRASASRDCGVVISTSHHGVVVWKAQSHSRGEAR